MSWYPDLSTTTLIDAGDHIRAIGWLSRKHPFRIGYVEPAVRERLMLFTHACAASTDALGWSICLGWHDCELCDRYSGSGIFGVPDKAVLYLVAEQGRRTDNDYGILPQTLVGAYTMNTVSERFLDSFDHLPQAVQWHVAAEILRRTVTFDLPPLSEDDLVLNAEMVFLALDAREADDEQAPTR